MSGLAEHLAHLLGHLFAAEHLGGLVAGLLVDAGRIEFVGGRGGLICSTCCFFGSTAGGFGCGAGLLAAAKVPGWWAVLADTFTVAVSDGHGGSTALAVTVGIGPANADPEVPSPVVGEPDESTGAVRGSAFTSDADGDSLTYSGSGDTAKGAVVVNGDGSFTYTPDDAARHAAAREGAEAGELADSFAVTITDGYGGLVEVAVVVAVSPANSVPVVAGSVVGEPDALTGVVTGSVSASDADGDALSFSSGAPSGKGGVVVVDADGSFTYTPNAEARHAERGRMRRRRIWSTPSS